MYVIISTTDQLQDVLNFYPTTPSRDQLVDWYLRYRDELESGLVVKIENIGTMQVIEAVFVTEADEYILNIAETYTYWSNTRGPQPRVKKCICDIKYLFDNGCRCGGFEAERRAALGLPEREQETTTSLPKDFYIPF